jgi:predicted MFS family arabinose efflux permease
MYLLKSWREARLSVAIFAVPLLFVVYQTLRHAPADIVTSSHASPEWLLTRGLSISGVLLLCGLSGGTE